MTDRVPAGTIDGANRDPSKARNTMLTNALIVNGLVLFAVLEADLGPVRKVSRFRLLRPLLTSATIVPLFLQPPAGHGTGLALEIGGGIAGVLLGLAATRLMRVRRDPGSGRIVSRAGATRSPVLRSPTRWSSWRSEWLSRARSASPSAPTRSASKSPSPRPPPEQLRSTPPAAAFRHGTVRGRPVCVLLVMELQAAATIRRAGRAGR
jgi:hypothetical protein